MARTSKLFNVLPPNASHDELDQALTHSMKPSQTKNGKTHRVIFANLPYLVITQLHCFMVSLAHVFHILIVSPSVKMCRIAAGSIVAMVAALKGFLDWSKSKLPSDPMSQLCSVANTANSRSGPTFKNPITFWGEMAKPRPTLGWISFLNLSPKPDFHWNFLRIHGGYGILSQIAA